MIFFIELCPTHESDITKIQFYIKNQKAYKETKNTKAFFNYLIERLFG